MACLGLLIGGSLGRRRAVAIGMRDGTELGAQLVRTGSILLATMSDLLDDAAKRANRYLESLNTRSVAPGKEAVAALAGFDRAFPEHTSAAEAVLAELDEIGSPSTMAS